MSSSKAPKPVLEHPAPDPDDDLDDLDDVLPQFSSGRPQPVPAAPPPTATHPTFTSRPRTNTRVDAAPISMPGTGAPLDSTAEIDEDVLSSEFAKELSMGMESLMREIVAEGKAKGAEKDQGEDGDGDDSEEARQAKMFKAAWEAMLVEGMNGPGEDELAELLANNAGAAGDGKASTGGFQDKIKQAMDKLKESETNLQGDAGTSGQGVPPTPESLEALLKSLGDLGLGEGEDETELSGFLENMMGQLMSKEVLYEPLKELADGFPPYLAKPPAPLSSEDRDRYEKQVDCVKRILAVFDKPGYSDTDMESNKTIVDLMSEMQSYGSPPTEIMGPLPPGMGEEGCVVA